MGKLLQKLPKRKSRRKQPTVAPASPIAWRFQTSAASAGCAKLAALSAMSYIFHRIFCATPLELEAEREAFYSVMAEFNENQAMQHGILFVTVSIVPNVYNLTVFQGAVDENISQCRYYVQVLRETWGGPQRSFEKSYELATKCAADPAMLMREVVLLSKTLPPDVQPEPAVLRARQEGPASGVRTLEFPDVETFSNLLRTLLGEWLKSALDEPSS